MLPLILKSIKNQKTFSFLFLLATVTILLVLPVLITTIQDNQTKIENNISQYSRGSYDLLVRPKNSRNEVEQTFGLVEENYLSYSAGGISIDEWKNILNMEDVEIAAPVATIGYFTGSAKSVAFPMPDESIRITAQFYTSNGSNNYKLRGPRTEIMLEREKAIRDDQFERLMNKNVFNFGGPGPPTYTLPNTYHLLVGVHPESEQKLTGISFDALRVAELTSRQESIYNRNFTGAPIVKVMKLNDPKVPVLAEVKADSLDIDSEETSEIKKRFGLEQYDFLPAARGEERDKYENILRFVLDYPAESSKSFNLDFSEKLDPFESTRLMVNKNGDIVENTEFGNFFNYGKSTVYYIPSKINYLIDKDNDKLVVSKQGNLSDFQFLYNSSSSKDSTANVPFYRNITEKGKLFGMYGEDEELPFYLANVGSYEIGNKTNKIASSPLGIYSLTPTIMESNGKEIHSTIYPGSFVASPAHGVTTIESASVIKGTRPIDAIRVRVGGIDDYTDAAATKIKDVAETIAMRGFEVDVVAGASPQQMEVEVEGIGTVLQPWTTLGAAATIVSGWNSTNIILTLAFSLVALIYIINRLSFAKVIQNRETNLLLQLGWDQQHITKKTRLEFIILSIIGFVISLTINGVLNFINNIMSFYFIQISLFAILLFLIVLSIKYNKSSKTVRSSHLNKLLENKTQFMTIKNLFYFWKYVRLPFIQLAIVSAFSAFVYSSIQATIEQTDQTFLGQFINTDTGVFQSIIIIGAYVLGLLTLFEGLTTLFNLRRKEFETFLLIGWERKHIFKLLLIETMIWSAASVLLGGIISIFFYTWLYDLQLHGIEIIFLSVAGFYITVLLFATCIIWILLNKRLN